MMTTVYKIKPFIFTDMDYGSGIRSVFLSLFFLLSLNIAGQTKVSPVKKDTSKSDVILIDHFGKLVEDTEGFEPVKWISKGLQLRIDSTYIYADSAVIFGEDRLFAYGNVVIQQGDSLHVFTDTLYYFRQTDIANLVGEVTLNQGGKQLWTRDLTYHLADRYGEYHQGGVLIDDSLQVSSRTGVYYADTEEVVFIDSVVVLHPEFNVAADSMKYMGSSSKVIFTGPTNIYTPEAKIYCESGFYDLENEVAEFNQQAQYAGQQKKATADTIRYASALGEILMLGNVHVEEEDRRIDGSSLRYLEESGETWISGMPATYSDSLRSIVSPEIFYNEKTNQVSTKGRGIIQDGDSVVEADNFSFDKDTGIGRASGMAMWRDTTLNLGIHADTIDSAKDSGYVLAYGDRRTLFYSLVDGDTLFIAADTLSMKNEVDSVKGQADTIRVIRAYTDVRLFKSDMQGIADSLSFNDRDSLFVFYGDPVLWSDTTQFSADTITMAIKNNALDNIRLIEKAIIISELYQTYYDQIKGKIVLAQFDSSAIKEMWVSGNAESIYYTRDDDDAFIGVNQTICSKMYFTFIDGQIHLLKYYGDNNSSMTPMSKAKHDALRLEGFAWRIEERPNSVIDLLK